MRLLAVMLVFGCGGKDDASQAASGDETAIDSGGSEAETEETGSPEDPTDPSDPEAVVLDSIHLDRTRLDLETGPDATQEYRFVLTGLWTDGSTERLLLDVEWAIEDEAVGRIDEFGLFTTSHDRGGRTYVGAAYDGLTTSAEVIVQYKDDLIIGGVDTALFDEAEAVPSEGSNMLYPEDGTVIPRNEPSMRFQWSGDGASLYKLAFKSDVTEINVYTSDLEWVSDEGYWPVISEANAGSEITSQLSAVIGDSVVEYASQRITVHDFEAVGSIIYWTPTAQGLMEIPYGESARNYLTVSETGYCVGCHAISSAGVLAASYGGGSSPLIMRNMETDEYIRSYDSSVTSNFKVFSPDARMLLVNQSGALRLYDGLSGELLGNPVIEGADYVTQMDWSPDDTQIVYATGTASSDLNLSSSEIHLAAHFGEGEFGPSEVLVTTADLDPSYGFTVLYYPTFSPDSQCVVFNASAGDSYDDLDATLFAVSVDGGEVIELGQANQGVGLSNSQPKWAPATVEDDVYWIAFSSRRAYGSITSGNPQIWMTSFDPEMADIGEDPSSPAIWLSNQATDQNNHVPVWVD